MGAINTAITLQDNFTAVLYNIINAVNTSTYAMMQMQAVMDEPIDTATMEKLRAQTDKATIAVLQLDAALQSIETPNFSLPIASDNTKIGVDVTSPATLPPISQGVVYDVPDLNIGPLTPLNQPVFFDVPEPPEWQSFDGSEVFTGTGFERFQQEVASVNSMLQELNNSQSKITQAANELEVLSPQAQYDIELVENRINALMQSIQQAEENPLNIGSDSANASLEQLRARLSDTIGLQENLNAAMQNGDISEINTAYLQLSQNISNTERMVRDSFENIPPVEIPVTWKSDSMEVFTGTGVERFQQEVQSANVLLQQLGNTQANIASQAAAINFLPPQAQQDLLQLNSRIDSMRERIQQISRNPINIGSSAANSQLEQLRGQLSQAVDEQQSLNRAFKQFDPEEANSAYLRLSATIGNAERNIRNNTDEQAQFNREVANGKTNANALVNSIKNVAADYVSIQSALKVLEISDDISRTTARLNLMVDDSGSVDELQNMIFQSAENSRGAYVDTINTVANLGTLAGDTFDSSGEIIAFAEQLQKQFVLAGASTSEIQNATLQLTQALASGVLRGDELNSVFDKAPTIMQAIADYMQIPLSTIRDMASEEQITAEIFKNSMFAAAEQTNAKFDEMPLTFEQIGTSIKNNLMKSFQPFLKSMNEIANSDNFQKFVDNLISSFETLGKIASSVFKTIMRISNFIVDNWSTIETVILGIVSAMTAWKIITTLNAIATGIAAAAAAGYTGIKAIAIGTTAAITGATIAQTAAQWGLNAALQACPLVWILDIIILVIAVLIVLAVLFAIFTEQIVGAIWWVGALFKNVGLWIANVALGVWNSIKNIGLWFANLGLSIWAVIQNIGLWFANLGQAVWAVIQNVGFWFANLGLGIWEVIKACASNVGTAFSNAWTGIQVGFWSMVDFIMQGLKSLAEFANDVLGWMGVDIDTSGMDFAAKKIEELNNSYGEFQDIGAAWEAGSNTFEYKDVGAAMDTYDYKSVEDAWNTNKIDWGKGWEDGFNTFDTFENGWSEDAYNEGAEIGAGIHDWIDKNLSIEGLLNQNNGSGKKGNGKKDNLWEEYYNGVDSPPGLDEIADDTGSIADSLEVTEEELKYLRDIAEQEAVNRFTTASITIEQTNHNNIASSLDIDGIIDGLTEGVSEAVNTIAEGVHA